MPRPPLSELPDREALRLIDLLSTDEAAPAPVAELVPLLRTLRGRSVEMAEAVDRSLLGQIDSAREALLEARGHMEGLRDALDKLSATPWHPAVFLDQVVGGDGPAALVACQGSVRVVAVGGGVAADSLAPGDSVLLGQDLNVILRRLDTPHATTGETAEFQRLLPDGRVVLRYHGADVVVRAARTLDPGALSDGSAVRWDRTAGLALEAMARPIESALFLEDTPEVGFDQIGGLDVQIARLTRTLRLHCEHPETARRYGVRRATSVLLVGPPGTGKTMLARALANWMGRRSPSGRSRFISIKPGQLHSMWFGESERLHRDAFRIAKRAADADPSCTVVMFFDEIDAAGAARGPLSMRVHDSVMTSLMTELDGLESRGNLVVVAATNRRDILDPAIARPGRLGDLVLEIPRPNMAAASAILARHLAPSIPYAAGDSAGDAAASRRRLIDIAVSRLYAPNGEGELASVVFRDGSRRALHARDLIGGAHLANIARAAVERACHREVEGGEPGVSADDLLEAIADELASAVSGLTPLTCHAHVSDLPQDLAVVRVEPAARAPARPHRFVRVA
jgi:proteasome-associated ATPase